MKQMSAVLAALMGLAVVSHLVHIAGWYNRVQVTGGDFVSAANLTGVDAEACGNGAYAAN